MPSRPRRTPSASSLRRSPKRGCSRSKPLPDGESRPHLLAAPSRPRQPRRESSGLSPFHPVESLPSVLSSYLLTFRTAKYAEYTEKGERHKAKGERAWAFRFSSVYSVYSAVHSS